MITHEQGERWHHAPTNHVLKGPCPRCLRDKGKKLNGCEHQLPYAQGYVVATFEIVQGHVLLSTDTTCKACGARKYKGPSEALCCCDGL
jgi:hypothetical protein